MPRVLDELADALHAAQGSRSPRRVINSLALRDQFRAPIVPAVWHRAGRLLCPLPGLRRRRGDVWSFPRGWRTVRDLAACVATWHSDWELPLQWSAADWREAQIFAGVRVCLVDAGNIYPSEVVRPARLQADLGLE